MGRHAAPGRPDEPQREPVEPPAAAGQQPAPARVTPGTEPPATTPPEPAAAPAWSLLTSLVVGTVVALVAGGVLAWAGQPWPVAVVAGLGTLAVVVGAAWVARSARGHQPLQ